MSRFQPIPTPQSREVPALGSAGLTQVNFVPPPNNLDFVGILDGLTSALRVENNDRKQREINALKLEEDQQRKMQADVDEKILAAKQDYIRATTAYNDAVAADNQAEILTTRSSLTNATTRYSTLLDTYMKDEGLSADYRNRLTNIYAEIETTEASRTKEVREAIEQVEQQQRVSSLTQNLDNTFYKGLYSPEAQTAIYLQSQDAEGNPAPLHQIRETAWNLSNNLVTKALVDQGYSEAEAKEIALSPDMQRATLGRVDTFMRMYENRQEKIAETIQTAANAEAVEAYTQEISQAVVRGDLGFINASVDTLAKAGINITEVYRGVNRNIVAALVDPNAKDVISSPTFIVNLESYLSLPGVTDAEDIRNTWKNQVLNLSYEWPVGGIPYAAYFENTFNQLNSFYNGFVPTYIKEALTDAAAAKQASREVRFGEVKDSDTPAGQAYSFFEQAYRQAGMMTGQSGIVTPQAKDYLNEAAIKHIAEYDTYNAMNGVVPEYDKISEAGLNPSSLFDFHLYQQAMKNSTTATAVYSAAKSDQDRLLLYFMANHDWSTEQTLDDYSATRQSFLDTIGVLDGEIVERTEVRTITLAGKKDPIISGLSARERDVVLYHAALQYINAGSPEDFDFGDQFKKSFTTVRDGMYITKSGYIFNKTDLPLPVDKPGGLKQTFMSGFHNRQENSYYDSSALPGVVIETRRNYALELTPELERTVTPFVSYMSTVPLKKDWDKRSIFSNSPINPEYVIQADGKSFAVNKDSLALGFVASRMYGASTSSFDLMFADPKAAAISVASYLMDVDNESSYEVVGVDYDRELAAGEVYKFKVREGDLVKVVTIPGSELRSLMSGTPLKVNVTNRNLPWNVADSDIMNTDDLNMY